VVSKLLLKVLDEIFNARLKNRKALKTLKNVAKNVKKTR